MILAPCNTDVSGVNEAILHQMQGESTIFHNADQVIQEKCADGPNELPVTMEFLHSITSSSLPPGQLKIKKSCPLLLMWNLSLLNGQCNGSHMVVVRASTHVLEVQLIGGDNNGQLVLIPCISFILISKTNFTFKIKQQQFPVQLVFALTINWAQGQSVKYVGLDLCNPMFAHGQLYIALSWATARQNVKVLLPHNNLDSKMVNVVYDKILMD